jgi:poly(A) polymerase
MAPMRRIISKVVQTLFGRRKEAAKPAVPAHTGHAARPAHAPAHAPHHAKPAKGHKADAPVVVAREQHTLSRTRIDEDALKVLNRLARNNHTAYLVGGGVRDLLLDRPVKDFDIATSAHPNEVKHLFRNCRLIGRRFRLAHILFRGGKVIEVSTFRQQAGFSDDGELLITSDNTFGTPEEDARRRDFTVNGLFYSITDFSVIDYVGGLEDLKRRVLRTIGDPDIRLREDPIRTLRGIRLAARLGFSIEDKTRAAMTAHRAEIWKSAAPRIVDEFVRMLNQGAAAASFPLLAELDMLGGLLPGFAQAYADPKIRAEVQRDLASLDAHQKPQGGLPAGLALAVLYYPLFASAVAAAGPNPDRVAIAAQLLDADLERLKFPRAQLEKAVQLLAAQQRLVQPPRRRARGAAPGARPWFAEALTLFEITQADTPEGAEMLQKLKAQALRPAAEPGAEGEQAGAEGGEETAAEAGAAEPGAEGGARRSRSRRRGRGRGRGRDRAREAEAPAEEKPEDAGTEAAEATEAPAAAPAPKPAPRPSSRREDRGSRGGSGRRSVAASREVPGSREDTLRREEIAQREEAARREENARREHGGRAASRRVPADDQDIVIDPDAAFGDTDTDLEPPGGGTPGSRTD